MATQTKQDKQLIFFTYIWLLLSFPGMHQKTTSEQFEAFLAKDFADMEVGGSAVIGSSPVVSPMMYLFAVATAGAIFFAAKKILISDMNRFSKWGTLLFVTFIALYTGLVNGMAIWTNIQWGFLWLAVRNVVWLLIVLNVLLQLNQLRKYELKKGEA